MKRKIFLATAIALFAIGAVVTTSVNSNSVTMKDIEVMAKADPTTIMDAGDQLKPLAWRTYYCISTQLPYEKCVHGGDGNSCEKDGSVTRNCPNT